MILNRLVNSLGRVGVGVGALGATASSALASVGTVPSMEDVVFPVDTASIVAAVVTAGAAILVLIWPVTLGFKMVWKLFRKSQKSI